MNPAQNPAYIATQAMNMGRNAEGFEALAFNRLALICMGVTALASATAVILPAIKDVLRELNHKHDKESGRGR